MKHTALIAALALSFSGGAVVAQTNDSMPAQTEPMPDSQMPPATAPATTPPANSRFAAIKQACDADFQALCPGMAPGDGKLGQCIRANRDKLSKGCGDALSSLRGARGRFRRQ